MQAPISLEVMNLHTPDALYRQTCGVFNVRVRYETAGRWWGSAARRLPPSREEIDPQEH